jgi:hypothetical protein
MQSPCYGKKPFVAGMVKMLCVQCVRCIGETIGYGKKHQALNP